MWLLESLPNNICRRQAKLRVELTEDAYTCVPQRGGAEL